MPGNCLQPAQAPNQLPETFPPIPSHSPSYSQALIVSLPRAIKGPGHDQDYAQAPRSWRETLEENKSSWPLRLRAPLRPGPSQSQERSFYGTEVVGEDRGDRCPVAVHILCLLRSLGGASWRSPCPRTRSHGQARAWNGVPSAHAGSGPPCFQDLGTVGIHRGDVFWEPTTCPQPDSF